MTMFAMAKHRICRYRYIDNYIYIYVREQKLGYHTQMLRGCNLKYVLTSTT